MDKNDVIKIMIEYKVRPSAQFIGLALKFNDEQLVRDFCDYWLNKRGVGGSDLLTFFSQHYKGGSR